MRVRVRVLKMGGVRVLVESDEHDESGKSKVFVRGGVLCWVEEDKAEQLMVELNDVINRYQL